MTKTDSSHLHDSDIESEQVEVEAWGWRLEVQSLVGTVQGSITISKVSVIRDIQRSDGEEVEIC